MVDVPATGDTGDLARRLTADLPDRYELVREHGRGGMATVFLAVDRKHERRVALKVLAPELAAGIGAERFLREIQIASHLSHPHIVPLLDSGLSDGRPFYVMPFVEGESLRERLAREGPLPIHEALRIASDVAEALVYAHAHGVVHRDIKPGNILLTTGSAVVTDFGVAVAMDEAADEHLTRTGLSVGTPGYMSPEQASGDHDLDGRTDQYSLAAVLFEMLAGDPPYTGRNARAIVGRQLSQPVPDICALRDGVPEELGEVCRKALGRTPADRYATMQQFARALEELAHRVAVGAGPVASRTRPAIWAALAVAVLAAAASWLEPGLGGSGANASTEARGDTTHYAIFPFRYAGGEQGMLHETQRLRDALTRWEGLSVVPQFQLEEAVLRTGSVPLRPEAAARVAVAQGAGRFLLGAVSTATDAYRIDAALYGGAGDLLESTVIRLPTSVSNVDSAFAVLVDGLLFPEAPLDQPSTGTGTLSVTARRAFDAGFAAIRRWDLSFADSAFDLAVKQDPSFGRAHLWLALSRAWSDQDPSRWRIPARQATLHRGGLTERDLALAEALQAQAEGDFGRACPRWRSITESQPRDFAAWYGLAMCLANDHAVVPDPDSPSNWRFRASRHEALDAYKTVFGYLPSVLESFHSNAYESLRGLFYLASTSVRIGRAVPPDTTTFRAVPSWEGDTLAFVPVSLEQYVAGKASFEPEPDAVQDAVRELRRAFIDVARAWVANAPESGRALHALAIGLAMIGDRSALDTLARARSMPVPPADSLELAGTEVWLRIGFSLPGDTAGLRRARFLADSLLANDEPLMSDPRLGAGLAALTGNADLAAAYVRHGTPTPRSSLSAAVQADARALKMFAAMGGPVDSLVRLERVVATAIDRLPEERRKRERGMWLALPASLSFPVHHFERMRELTFDWVVETQLALTRGDTSGIRRALHNEEKGRLSFAPYNLTLDALYPEAHLFLSIGDAGAAARRLDPTLQALSQADLSVLSEPTRIAALIRAAGLRASIAEELADREGARRWAQSVLLFWMNGEASGPTVDRARRIAEGRRVG